MKRKYLFFVLFLSLFGSSFGQNFDELERVVNEEMREKNAVGAGIAIVQGNQIIYSKGFGFANIETQTPITPETLFQVGSVTKTFTAALLLSMEQENLLKLDAPIGNSVKNLDSQINRMTLYQLLSHTAGIIDEPDEYGTADESSMANYIRSWKADYRLFEGGRVFSYSNAGYALAGFAAQETSGKPYIDLISEKIFKPLGMKTTTFRPTVAMTYPLAVGHQIKPNEKPSIVRPLPQDARLYPAGTFYSNLHDLARFANAFLNQGKLDGKQIIAANVVEKMSEPRARQLSEVDEISYGYGLFINQKRGVRTVWHDGSMTGYTASMLLAPDQKVAVIILSNTNGVTLNRTQEKALELMLPLKKQATVAAKPAVFMSRTEMDKLVGTYVQPKRFNIEIFIKNNRLFIKEFNREMELTKVGENRFSFQFPNAPQPIEIYIQPTENGKTGFIHQYVWAFKRI